ncbi:MAG: MFS transporter [Bacteroidia bacterium]|nr:MFS transporter [Bacteroidia bacterium]
MTTGTQGGKNSILTIFFTVFLDLLGVTLIIPILAPLLIDSNDLLGPEYSYEFRTRIMGFLIAVFSVCQFISSPFLGSLSDKYGRKPVLFFSLFVTFFGYLIFASGVIYNQLTLLFLGRAMSGIAAGNISVIFSAIADVSNHEEKARNFGVVGIAFGLGFIIGPVLGGLLADPEIVSWFSFVTPFFFAALLVCINLILVWFNFPETLAEPNKEARVSLLAGFQNSAKAFKHPQLRNIFLVVFLFTFGFAFFTQFFQVFLIKKFTYNQSDIGLLFGFIGINIALTQGILVRFLSKRFSPAQVTVVSMLLLVFAFIILLIPDTSLGLYMVIPGVALSQGLASPNLSAIISNSVSADKQGETLGMQQSMQSLAQAVPPIISGYAISFALEFPIWMAAISTFAAWGFFMIIYRAVRKKEQKITKEE